MAQDSIGTQPTAVALPETPSEMRYSEAESSKASRHGDSIECVAGQAEGGDVGHDILRLVSRASHKSVPDVPPNGGWVAWSQVVAAFMCNLNAWGIINSFGEFQDYYTDNLLRKQTPFQISWIGSLTACMTFIGSVAFGALVDRGLQRPMLIAAGLTQCFALMMLSLCDSYWQVILCQGVLYGFAASAAFLVGMGTVAPWFSTKRPLAMGCAVLGSSVGGAVYSSAVHKMLPEIGFGWTVRVLGFIVLGTSMVPCLLIRPRLPPRRDGGLVALECLEEPVFLVFCLGSFLAFSGFFQFYFYYQSWGVRQVPDSTVLPYLTAIMNGCSSLGRVLPPYLAQRYGAYNVNILAVLSSTGYSFGWMGATDRESILAVGIMFGIMSGPIVAMPPVIVAMLTPNMNRIGVRLSFAFLSVGGGCLVGPPFTGMLIRQYGWFYGKLYCALTFLLSAICIATSKLMHTRGQFFQKT